MYSCQSTYNRIYILLNEREENIVRAWQSERLPCTKRCWVTEHIHTHTGAKAATESTISTVCMVERKIARSWKHLDMLYLRIQHILTLFTATDSTSLALHSLWVLRSSRRRCYCCQSIWYCYFMRIVVLIRVCVCVFVFVWCVWLWDERYSKRFMQKSALLRAVAACELPMRTFVLYVYICIVVCANDVMLVMDTNGLWVQSNSNTV